MMDNSNNTAYSVPKTNLSNLTKRTPIRIPKIQRDYAQGRNNDTAKDIRTKFVHDLVSAVKHGDSLELDFIYGSYQKNAFEPLDGQQRLTTLFLLHWVCGADLYNREKDLSLLSYETRNTSTDFCLELVKHEASQFITEINKSNEYKSDCVDNAEKELNQIKALSAETRPADYQELLEKAQEELANAKNISVKTFSSLIKNRDWFNYLWQYDPTIQSMLVMLDTIYDEFLSQKMLPATFRSNLDKITFSNLDLGTFDLSDDLFIKMNARGKQLSTYDILKSSLEEEIQIQKNEGLCDLKTETDWRSYIDGEWIDWFWNMYASNKIGEITESDEEYKGRLKLAKKAEEYLKRLLLRCIALRLVRVEGIDEDLKNLCYNNKLDSLDRLMIVYNDSLRKTRTEGQVPESSRTIPFADIIEDITCLYYKEGDSIYKNITSLIPENYNLNSDNRSLSYFDWFVADDSSNDARMVFFCILRFAQIHPLSLISGQPDKQWVQDFEDWAHFIRNLFLYENNNTRIDKFERFRNAMTGVNKLLESLESFYSKISVNNTILDFIISLDGASFNGIDSLSLSEEIQKARLKKSDNGEWKTVLDKAESHRYLWGQVRCLLDWAEGNSSSFKEYYDHLAVLLDYKDQNLVYTGIMSIDPSYGFKTSRLYQFNKDRDYSFKRYFRDNLIKDKSGHYAPSVKSFLDAWMSSGMTIEDFVKHSIQDSLSKGHSYVNCILEFPSMLNFANDKMIFPHDGHYVLAQRRTESSHCYDISLMYLKNKYKDNPHLSQETALYDSSGSTYQHATVINYKQDRVLIKAVDKGGYEFSVNEESPQMFRNEKDMLEYTLTHYPL